MQHLLRIATVKCPPSTPIAWLGDTLNGYALYNSTVDKDVAPGCRRLPTVGSILTDHNSYDPRHGPMYTTDVWGRTFRKWNKAINKSSFKTIRLQLLHDWITLQTTLCFSCHQLGHHHVLQLRYSGMSPRAGASGEGKWLCLVQSIRIITYQNRRQ